MKTIELMDALRERAPSVAFRTHRDIDHHFRWDGDGPDPRDEFYDPYDVTVAATVIDGGALVTNEEYLGGCYYKQEEPIDDIHGYLPQMLKEAASGLLKRSQNETHKSQLESCIVFLKAEMRRRYDEQMRPASIPPASS